METAIKNQIRRLQQKVDNLQQLTKRISSIRLGAFLAGMLLIYLAARSGNSWLFAITAIAAIAAFMWLISRHRKIDEAIEQFSAWKKIRRRHLARKILNWDEIPRHSLSVDKYRSHPFARDYNIIGKHSLLQLIDTTTYQGSRNYVKTWLLNRQPDIAELSERQKLIKELKPMAHFRDRIHLYASTAQKKKKETDWNMQQLLQWLGSTHKNGYTTPLIILGSLAVINITLLALFLIGIIGPFVIFSFVIYMLTYNFYSSKISGLFDEARQIEKLLTQFRPVLLYLESFTYQKESKLAGFCNVYHQPDKKPSHYLKKIIRIASAASSQSSELIWLLLNIIGPWDMYYAKKLNAYKNELEPKLTHWLERFYRLEALNCIANFAWLNDDYIFALPNSDETSAFKAERLGHPLIPENKKVTNDLTIENTGDILLITGSNMAGKSTFLRTIGINLCLCFAGAPVNAAAFQTIPFRLFSSINVTDSLDEGLSHFYAEVKRLRELLDELNKVHSYPLFYMVDEIYRGTNNRERLKGSTAFLKQISEKNGIGLISTHDLELSQLETEITTLSNWHFEETIENGEMHFEYKLKHGPCPTTNALKIMKMEGLPT